MSTHYTHSFSQNDLSVGDVVSLEGALWVVTHTAQPIDSEPLAGEEAQPQDLTQINVLAHAGCVDIRSAELISASPNPRPIILTANGVRLKTPEDASYNGFISPLASEASVGSLVAVCLK